jgi:hypothetical protein
MSRPVALFRNEMLKTFKRLATWVTLGLFSFIVFMNFGDEYLGARKDPERTFALPDAWPKIFGDGAFVGLVFGTVLLILMVAGEFSWRTARQNVIDGLSKGRWYWAKTILIPMLAVVFIGELTVVGGFFAYLGTDASAVSGPLMGATQWAAIGGLMLGFMLLASMGFAAAMAIRSQGPAMAVWFFYIGFGERLLLGGLSQLGEWIRPALRFAPFSTVQGGLANYLQWDPVALQRATERAIEAERTPPEIWDGGTLLITAVAWLAFFVVGSFLWFRRRDL